MGKPTTGSHCSVRSLFALPQRMFSKLALVSCLSVISTAAAEDLHGFLNPNDPVAMGFWIISISMVAATVFFLMESTAVGTHWKTSLNVGALVTLVAAVHYFYMRMFWRLLLGTVAMLAAGYCGEAGFVNAWAGFIVGLAGWAFILQEIFVGEGNSAA